MSSRSGFGNLAMRQKYSLLRNNTGSPSTIKASAESEPKANTCTTSTGVVALPRLPNEIWLQILEQIDEVEYLWCTVRLVSKTYKALVDRTFVTSFLPTISISLALPRRDPKTGRLRHLHPVPRNEIVFQQYRNPDVGSPTITLETTTSLSASDTVEQLTESGALSKQRLDEAEAWMWFGRQRGKGANVAIDKDVHWNEEKKIWIWTVEWKGLVHKHFNAKRASRRTRQ